MKRHPAQRFQIGDLGPRKPEGLQRQAAQRAEVCDPGRSEPPTGDCSSVVLVLVLGGAFEEEDEEDDLRSNRSTNFVSMAWLMAKIEKTLSTTKPTTVTGAAQPTRRKSCPATSARKPRNVKCVVSVSMLTEGWDANMVTHVLGVRALGTQLRCEQVVGRGLRRMSYQAEPCTLALPDGSVANFEAFPVAYAEVYGVPFSFIPSAGSSSDPKPGPIPTRVRALADRQQACEIQFPRIDGYRYVAQIVVSGGAMRPGGDRSSVKTDAGLASTPPLAGVMG